jgi:hypothetical protein
VLPRKAPWIVRAGEADFRSGAGACGEASSQALAGPGR